MPIWRSALRAPLSPGSPPGVVSSPFSPDARPDETRHGWHPEIRLLLLAPRRRVAARPARLPRHLAAQDGLDLARGQLPPPSPPLRPGHQGGQVFQLLLQLARPRLVPRPLPRRPGRRQGRGVAVLLHPAARADPPRPRAAARREVGLPACATRSPAPGRTPGTTSATARRSSRTARLDFDDVPESLWREAFRHEWLLASGDYLGQLRRWLEVFPREQILVGFYESIAAEPADLLRRVFGFLGVDPTLGPRLVPAARAHPAGPRQAAAPRAPRRLARPVARRARVGRIRQGRFSLDPPPAWTTSSRRPRAGRRVRRRSTPGRCGGCAARRRTSPARTAGSSRTTAASRSSTTAAACWRSTAPSRRRASTTRRRWSGTTARATASPPPRCPRCGRPSISTCSAGGRPPPRGRGADGPRGGGGRDATGPLAERVRGPRGGRPGPHRGPRAEPVRGGAVGATPRGAGDPPPPLASRRGPARARRLAADSRRGSARRMGRGRSSRNRRFLPRVGIPGGMPGGRRTGVRPFVSTAISPRENAASMQWPARANSA